MPTLQHEPTEASRLCSSDPPKPSNVSRARILLVDDDPLVRRLLRVSLGPDYEIGEAADGGEAVAIATRERPDLVLLDLNLPVLSGLDVCRAIKTDPRTRHIHVVVVTVRSAIDDRRRARAAGADDYLIKPFSPIQLLRDVDRFLHDAEHADRLH